MSYTITEDVITKASTQKWLDPGVHSDLEFSHRAEVSSNGNAFLAYEYTNPLGQKSTRTEWEVDEVGPFEKLQPWLQNIIMDIANDRKLSQEEAIKAYRDGKVKAQMRRILTVAKLFVPEEELNGKTFKSFEEFIKFVSNKIGDKCKGVKLRVKMTYDRKGWVNTPDYVRENTPWIERVDEVPEGESKIKVVEGLDKMVRNVPNGKRPPKKASPLLDDASNDAPKKEDGDDLPF